MKAEKKFLQLVLACAALNLMSAMAKCPSYSFAYVGSYTNSPSWVKGSPGKGIEVYLVHPKTGDFKPIETQGTNETGQNPSYLAISNNQKFLFNVNEDEKGAVHSFRINSFNGRLTHINQQSIDGFSSAVHLMTDKNDKFLHVAYYSGHYAVFPISDDGALGSPVFKTGYPRYSQPHMVQLSPRNDFVYVSDFGLDKVWTYSYNSSTGIPTDLEHPYITAFYPGPHGPRHIAFHPTKPFAYLLMEISSQLDALNVTSSGELVHFQSYVTPKDVFSDPLGAAVRIDSKGKFLYVTNRNNENSIRVFEMFENGELGSPDTTYYVGRHPRDFNFYGENFLYVLAQDDDSIEIFRRTGDGKLLSAGNTSFSPGSPVSIQLTYIETACNSGLPNLLPCYQC